MERIPKRKIISKKKYQIDQKSYTMKELVSMPSWQKLREKLVGTWKENKSENIRKLRNWLGPISKATMKKLLIMRNYLTGSGFRSGKIKGPEISKLRTQVSREISKRNR